MAIQIGCLVLDPCNPPIIVTIHPIEHILYLLLSFLRVAFHYFAKLRLLDEPVGLLVKFQESSANFLHFLVYSVVGNALDDDFFHHT